MNKIVKVTFGNTFNGTEISAGSENTITVHDFCEGGILVAVKRDKDNRLMQEMILGTGCVITYQEVEA